MKKTLAPLREVVDFHRDEVTGVMWEVLECGHKLRVKQDIYGPTNASRRRCRHCSAAATQEPR